MACANNVMNSETHLNKLCSVFGCCCFHFKLIQLFACQTSVCKFRFEWMPFHQSMFDIWNVWNVYNLVNKPTQYAMPKQPHRILSNQLIHNVGNVNDGCRRSRARLVITMEWTCCLRFTSLDAWTANPNRIKWNICDSLFLFACLSHGRFARNFTTHSFFFCFCFQSTSQISGKCTCWWFIQHARCKWREGQSKKWRLSL